MSFTLSLLDWLFCSRKWFIPCSSDVISQRMRAAEPSAAHMFLLPAWKFSKLPLKIPKSNLGKFHPCYQSQCPTKKKKNPLMGYNYKTNRTWMAYGSGQRRCFEMEKRRRGEGGGIAGLLLRRELITANAKLSLSSQWPHYSFKHGLS